MECPSGLGLEPDPADPANWIRRIRADIETAGPDPGARGPRALENAQNSLQLPPKRPKMPENPPDPASGSNCRTGSGRHSIPNPSPDVHISLRSLIGRERCFSGGSGGSHTGVHRLSSRCVCVGTIRVPPHTAACGRREWVCSRRRPPAAAAPPPPPRRRPRRTAAPRRTTTMTTTRRRTACSSSSAATKAKPNPRNRDGTDRSHGRGSAASGGRRRAAPAWVVTWQGLTPVSHSVLALSITLFRCTPRRTRRTGGHLARPRAAGRAF